MTFCYFCNHPYPLVIFDAIARIAKAGGLDVKHHLIFSKHRYFDDLDYAQFVNRFDRVDEVPYVETRRNIIAGLSEGRQYVRALERVRLERDSVFFTISYSDLATNLFCSYARRFAPKGEMVHLTIYGNFLDISSGRFSLVKTLHDGVYSALLRGYFLSSYVDDRGNVLEKIYWNDPHTQTLQLMFPAQERVSSFVSISFPHAPESDSAPTGRSKAVLFFGDGTLESYYSDLDRNVFYDAINRTLGFLRSKYRSEPGVKIFYKPHPLDRGRVPDEVRLDGIEVFRERLSAEMILLQSDLEVLETYSVSSTACLTASHFGIPSFGIYRICGFPEYVVDRFAGHFKTANPACFMEVRSWEQLEAATMKRAKIDRRAIGQEWLRFLEGLVQKRSS